MAEHAQLALESDVHHQVVENMVLIKLHISQTDNIKSSPPAQVEIHPQDPPERTLSDPEQNAFESVAILQAVTFGISFISF